MNISLVLTEPIPKFRQKHSASVGELDSSKIVNAYFQKSYFGYWNIFLDQVISSNHKIIRHEVFKNNDLTLIWAILF